MQIEAGAPDVHLTFTLRRTASDSPDRARRRLGLAIAEFLRRVKRLMRYQLEYFAAIERHKSGWPHAHVAVRGWKFLHKKRIEKLWREVTGDSDHLWVRRIPPTRAKKYLAKYLGKDLHRFSTSKRYWHSKGYLPADFGKPTEEQLERWQGWSFVREHPDVVIRDYRSRGWFAHWPDADGCVLTAPPWAASAPRGPPQAAAAGCGPT